MRLAQGPRVSEHNIAGPIGNDYRVGPLQQLPLILIDQLRLGVVAGIDSNNRLPEQISQIEGILGRVIGYGANLAVDFGQQFELAL